MATRRSKLGRRVAATTLITANIDQETFRRLTQRSEERKQKSPAKPAAERRASRFSESTGDQR